MKEKKIHFSRGEVAEIDSRAKVDFETEKEVKREILDRERDRGKTITEERRQRALAARKAKKEREQLQEESTTWIAKKQACSVRGKAKHCRNAACSGLERFACSTTAPRGTYDEKRFSDLGN